MQALKEKDGWGRDRKIFKNLISQILPKYNEKYIPTDIRSLRLRNVTKLHKGTDIIIKLPKISNKENTLNHPEEKGPDRHALQC